MSEAESNPDRLRALVMQVYADADTEVQAIGPVCQLSGRCCRFEEYGHTLFLSGIEANVLITHAPGPARPLDDGETCPWQDARGRCTARESRPLGCRVYYCDETYGDSAQGISERAIARLKAISDRAEIPWNYRPLHSQLRDAAADGRIVFPIGADVQRAYGEIDTK